MSPTVETRNGAGPPVGEIGSAWSWTDRLFETFADGKVFATSWDWFEREIDTMLDRDGKARALEQVLTLPLRAAPWSVEPAAGDSGEAEFVREALTTPANNGGMSTPIELVVGQLTSACLYRRAYFEKVWRVRDDGRVDFDKLAFRPAVTCRILRDENTYSFQGFEQHFRQGGDYVTRTIGPDKALVFIHGQHRNPLNGVSDLRTAHAIWQSKQKVRFLWYQFLENQTIPKAVAKHSVEDPGEVQKFAQKVATLKGGGVVGIGPDQDVRAFESSGAGAAVFGAAIKYLDQEMFASCLAGFADLAGAASSGRGSFALSKDQSDFFLQARQAVLDEMGACLTNFAVADLIRWNFGSKGRVPFFRFGNLAGSLDANDVVTLFQALGSAVTPSPLIPREFIDALTLKVAAFLELDVDKVKAAIDARIASGSDGTPTGDLRAGIDAAVSLVQQAGVVPSEGGAAPAAATPAA